MQLKVHRNDHGRFWVTREDSGHSVTVLETHHHRDILPGLQRIYGPELSVIEIGNLQHKIHTLAGVEEPVAVQSSPQPVEEAQAVEETETIIEPYDEDTSPAW